MRETEAMHWEQWSRETCWHSSCSPTEAEHRRFSYTFQNQRTFIDNTRSGDDRENLMIGCKREGCWKSCSKAFTAISDSWGLMCMWLEKNKILNIKIKLNLIKLLYPKKVKNSLIRCIGGKRMVLFSWCSDSVSFHSPNVSDWDHFRFCHLVQLKLPESLI